MFLAHYTIVANHNLSSKRKTIMRGMKLAYDWAVWVAQEILTLSMGQALAAWRWQ
jgi:hypothetical protein